MKEVKTRNPWLFIPTLYFAEGVPYVIINTVSVILYKKMGISNTEIAFWTSFLYLPWVIKMFWGPMVDTYSTKRNWVIFTQFLMMCCLGLISFVLHSPVFFFISLFAFVIGAFVSATYDIATDGFYMISLDKEKQAYFVGLRSVFYRMAMIFGSGFLVYLAGYLEGELNNIAASWSIAIGLAAILFGAFFVYHRFILPFPVDDKKRSPAELEDKTSFKDAFASYFKQSKIGIILLFILFYRFGEAMLIKLTAPFLIDKRILGGLELTTQDVGFIYGTIGVIALILGAILGGWAIAKYGLKKCIWPMVFILNFPNIAYLYLAYVQSTNLYEIGTLIALEQFGYGFGFTAYTVYLMYISRGKYKTSHFAISTGIMALGMMIPGFWSGWLQSVVGYKIFFWIVLLMCIPGILTLFFIPMDIDKKVQNDKK